jgi:hypothetical protein
MQSFPALFAKKPQQQQQQQMMASKWELRHASQTEVAVMSCSRHVQQSSTVLRFRSGAVAVVVTTEQASAEGSVQ